MSEDTKNLLKHKDDLSFNDKVKLSDLDHNYKTALKDRKTDKYLSKNNYYGDKPVRGEAHSLRMDTINDDIKNALIKKAIYDIKYGNESRGLKNLNRLLDLKGKDLSPVDNNAEMFKSAFTNMFSKLGSLDKYNDPKVKHVKIGKIGKVYDSKMKDVKFIDRLKNLFKGKDPHTGLELSESENKLIETAAEVVLRKCKNLSESEQIKICLGLIKAKLVKEGVLGYFGNNIKKSWNKIKKLDKSIGDEVKDELGLENQDEEEALSENKVKVKKVK